MNATKIEYLNFTWSPLVGCSGVNCAVYAKCWAKYQAKRQLHKCPKCYGFKPHTHFERLSQPLKVKKPSRIGVTFSADFWDEGFTIQDRKQVFGTAIEAPWHWYINLTKQPQNIPEALEFPKSWIQGVSVCTKKDLWRIETLKKTQARYRAVSFEPLYEDLGKMNLAGIHWAIVGAQTHPLKIPSMFWVENLIEQTDTWDIPLFVKNNLKGYEQWKEIPFDFEKKKLDE